MNQQPYLVGLAGERVDAVPRVGGPAFARPPCNKRRLTRNDSHTNVFFLCLREALGRVCVVLGIAKNWREKTSHVSPICFEVILLRGEKSLYKARQCRRRVTLFRTVLLQTLMSRVSPG